jgi:ribonuclease-3
LILERKIRIKFKDHTLLETAFVHTSYLNEHKSQPLHDNERLEFLGDAVLELVTTEHLYGSFPETKEGQLTSFRSALVKGKHLAEVARTLGLGQYLLLSHGEEKSGGREKNYILANTLEALIGAIYLDRGFLTAHKFIDRFILTNLGDILRKGLHVDAKSRLQELSQEKLGITPSYQVLSESGPDHNKVFEVGAFIEGNLIGKGTGSSKQKAEEQAALAASKGKGWL